LVKFIQHNPKCAYGALHHRGIGNIKAVPFGFERLPGLSNFDPAMAGKIDIRPPRKMVFPIPQTFTVPQ